MVSRMDRVLRAYWFPVVAFLALVALSLFLLYYRPSSSQPPVRFSLLEGGTVQWYELSGTSLSRIPAPLASVTASSTEAEAISKGFAAAFTAPGFAVGLAVDGVVRVGPGNGKRKVILDRPGLSAGLSAIAPDASAVALENGVTGSIDVFSIGYDASATSYIGSLPIVPLSIAFTTPTEFVVHDKDGYELFTIGKEAVSKTATLTLQP